MKAANLITELAKVQINKRNSPEEMHFQQKNFEFSLCWHKRTGWLLTTCKPLE